MAVARLSSRNLKIHFEFAHVKTTFILYKMFTNVISSCYSSEQGLLTLLIGTRYFSDTLSWWHTSFVFYSSFRRYDRYMDLRGVSKSIVISLLLHCSRLEPTGPVAMDFHFVASFFSTVSSSWALKYSRWFSAVSDALITKSHGWFCCYFGVGPITCTMAYFRSCQRIDSPLSGCVDLSYI